MSHPTPLAPRRALSPGARLRGLPSSTSAPRPLAHPDGLRRFAPGRTVTRAPHYLRLTPRVMRPISIRTKLFLRVFAGESVREDTGPPGSALDALLSAAELLCLAPLAICSAVCAVRLIRTPGATVKPAAAALASGRLFVVQYVLLLGVVAIGVLIRRRQWGRLCRLGGSGAAATGGVDLVGRIDKVEDSVRGVVTAVGVLSRTVEKLSVRFRVLRRTLRDPISEAATLAQKNSEATRILAAQENLLEKEIGSIQKVLYAMQEQQEKQLELILAIGEATRILDDKQDLLGEGTVRSSNSVSEQKNKRAKLKGESVTGSNNKP